MKRIDFPVKPHVLKYLQVHLRLAPATPDAQELQDYVLSKTDQFGFALYQLLRRPVKSARHEGSAQACTTTLGVNLRNFNYPYYELSQGRIPAYTVFQFNDFVDEVFKTELYRFVRDQIERRSTIKEAILSFMSLYSITEEDIQYETLRKAVQRNVPVLTKKSRRKGKNLSMNLSQKTGDLSRKTGDLSQKIGVLSHKDSFRALRQHLAKLPLPLYDIESVYASRV